jgi:hypothetical protein
VLVVPGRAGDAGVQVEQAAGLGCGERDQLIAVFIRYDRWRGVCSRRREDLSTAPGAPFLPVSLPVTPALPPGGTGRRALAVTARNACASMTRVTCRYQAVYCRTWQWSRPASFLASAKQSSMPHLAPATATSSASVVPRGA